MTLFELPVRSTTDSADFFDFAIRGRLLLRRCLTCAEVRGPQTQGCPRCGAENAEAFAASPQARLITWAIVHRSPVPGLEAPYTAAVVECQEGPWVLVRLLAPQNATLSAGVTVTFDAVRSGADGEHLIVARV